MTFPRKLGILLLAVAAASVGAHWGGWSLPSLRWFYSFRVDPAELVGDPTWWSKHQHEIIGHAMACVMALAGVLLLALGGRFHWNPLTVKRFQRFRSIGRGWWSFRILMVLVVVALLDQVLVGRRALAVRHEGTWYFPAFREEEFTEATFGGTSQQEANYRELAKRFREEDSGNRVILPLVPWDPTFDSDEVQNLPLEEKEGVVMAPGGREPYNGEAVKFRKDKPGVLAMKATFRKGIRHGVGERYDGEGDFESSERWEEGRRVSPQGDPGPAEEELGDWQRRVYPPAVPTFPLRNERLWFECHWLGTDSKGWDILAQLYGGLQVMMKAAAVYVLMTYVIGILIGCMEGYFGGWFDIISQRFSEVVNNVPFLLVVMVITANIGLEKITLGTILLIFCLFSWINVAMYLRTATYREKARDYVAAARVQGAGTFRVIFRHILPNATSTIVTLLPFSVAGLATSLTALDFLGFGLPNRYPSWGRLLQDGTENLTAPWMASSVFVVLVGVLLLITFVGEAIREAFDPKKFTTYQ